MPKATSERRKLRTMKLSDGRCVNVYAIVRPVPAKRRKKT